MSDHHSISTRKIKNGWVVSRCSNDGGEYRSEEEFHSSKPRIRAPEVTEPERSALRRASGGKRVTSF